MTSGLAIAQPALATPPQDAHVKAAPAEAVVLSAPTKSPQALRFGEEGYTAAKVHEFSRIRLLGRTVEAVVETGNKQASNDLSSVRWTRASRSKARQASGDSGSVSKPEDLGNVSKAGVIGIARRYLGVPYVYGGTSPRGFDCSGLMQYVFRKAGVSLPRTAGAQRAHTRRVSNPVPGDLVFWGTHHVGLYVGGGKVLHAPRTGKNVSIVKLWGSYSFGRVR